MPNQLTLKCIPLFLGAIFMGACAATAEPIDLDEGTEDLPEESSPDVPGMPDGTVSERPHEICNDPDHQPPSDNGGGDSVQLCGNDAELQCCNSLVEQASQDLGIGILNDLLGQVSLGSGCTPILSASQCSQKVACCDSSTEQNGLINVNALNCVQVPLL